jgi:hypothetical protein
VEQDDDAFGGFDEELSEIPDLSVNYYPNPYCGIVESLPTACFHVSSVFHCLLHCKLSFPLLTYIQFNFPLAAPI